MKWGNKEITAYQMPHQLPNRTLHDKQGSLVGCKQGVFLQVWGGEAQRLF